jgi:hypothetical protein
MLPIAIAIGDVVHQVHDARERAENHEGRRGTANGDRIGEPLAEQQPGEDEEVLGPLAGPHRDDEARRQRAVGRTPASGRIGHREFGQRRARHGSAGAGGN